jgi:alpha-tubulin suppressor-like RCC1 family protein
VAALADYEVKAVACGYEHTVCVTHKDVLAWGSNEHGQLGLGEAAAECCPRPYPIKLLHDVMVTQVVCGKFHTICVTAQSQVGLLGEQLGRRG